MEIFQQLYDTQAAFLLSDLTTIAHFSAIAFLDQASQQGQSIPLNPPDYAVVHAPDLPEHHYLIVGDSFAPKWLGIPLNQLIAFASRSFDIDDVRSCATRNNIEDVEAAIIFLRMLTVREVVRDLTTRCSFSDNPADTDYDLLMTAAIRLSQGS